METRPLASFQTFTELKLLPAGGGWARFLLVPEADDLTIFLPLVVLAPGPLFQFPCSWVSLAFKLLWVFTSVHVPGSVLPQGFCVLSPSFQYLYASTHGLAEMAWNPFSCLALLLTPLTMPGLSCQGALFPTTSSAGPGSHSVLH